METTWRKQLIFRARANSPAYLFRVSRLTSLAERAISEGGGVILGGSNYGQGSSREHAALVPQYLGIKAVVAKSFARIHVANLINFGIVPMTLVCEDDYDKFSEGDDICIEGFKAAIAGAECATLVNRTTGATAKLSLAFTSRQREILLAGGTLNYTKLSSAKA